MVSASQLPDPLKHLPDSLLDRIGQDVPADSVQSAAQFDLDNEGRFAKRYLLLAEGQLGVYARDNGQWHGKWLTLEGVDEAHVVEGLGMSVLRLVGGERTHEEFRYTLRCAKRMARLHRQLERQLGPTDANVADEEPPAENEDAVEDKKARCPKCDRPIPPWAEHCPACMSRRKVLTRLMDFIKPYKWSALIGLAIALASTGAHVARPFLTKPILNRGLGLQEGYEADYPMLLGYVFILAGLTLAVAFGTALRRRLLGRLGSRVARDVRDTTYQHLHKLSLSFFTRKPTGSLVTRITSDSDRIWDFIAFTLVESATAFFTISAVMVVMFSMAWKLALFTLIPIPLMITMTIVFHKKMHKFHRRIFHRWSQMTAIVADALPGVRVIKAFGQERREISRFGAKNQHVYDGEMEMISTWTLFQPVMMLCSQIGTLTVWLLGGYWAVTGQLDPGTLLAFAGAMWLFYGPIHMISHMDRMFNRAATSVQRIFEILDTEPAIFSRSGAQRADHLHGSIELRNVSFSYDGIRRVLKNVSLKIEPGQMIGLAGPSGGGKTTLVNLICRFYDVLEGQILIDGVDVRDYDLEDLRRHVGIVLQEPFLFHGTVAENIAYGHPDASLDEIITAAKAANAHDFIVGFADGYDTLVGERGQALSGGERQRISIARAILDNPRILILDEATSSVDTETEKLIQEALDRLIADRTTIAIAHRLSTLRKADKLVILEKGELIEEGSHEELAEMGDGLYAKLLRMQNEMQSVMAI